MKTLRTSLELSNDLHILVQQLRAPTEYFNFPRTFITDLELKSYHEVRDHHGLGHIFTLGSLIAPHENCANNPNIRTIKAGGKDVRVYTTPLTQHLIDVAAQYQDLLQTIPYKSWICLSWVDHAVKDVVAIGSSFIHAVLNEDSKDPDTMMQNSNQILTLYTDVLRQRMHELFRTMSLLLWLTNSILEYVYNEH